VISELKDSVVSAAKERLASPILGTYIIFFLWFHWRAFVMLCSSPSSGAKLISEVSPYWPHSLQDVFIPLACTAIFLTAYPVIKIAYSVFLKVVRLLQIHSDFFLSRREMKLEEQLIVRESHMAELREQARHRQIELAGRTDRETVDRVLSAAERLPKDARQYLAERLVGLDVKRTTS
jgi:hypothetical protein